MFLLVPAYPGCPGSKAVKRSLLLLLLYILFENMFIYQHWNWPAQRTGTVPIVSAHFRSLLVKKTLRARKTMAETRGLRQAGRRMHPPGCGRIAQTDGQPQNIVSPRFARLIRMLYKNCHQPIPLHPAAVLLSPILLVFALLESFILFVCFIIAMYAHHFSLYCILFRRFLISKTDVALQFTKL